MPQKSTKVQRVCEACGASFAVFQSTLRQYPARYCSIPCRVAPKHSVLYIGGDVAYIPLCKRDGTIVAFSRVDAADAECLGRHQWHLSSGYARRTEQRSGAVVTIRMHREILGLYDGDALEGDHIDRNRLNNRRENLRVVSRSANMQNKTPYRGKRSAYRGVSYDQRTGLWYAKVRVNNRTTFLGSFADERVAAKVAKEARTRLMPYATD